MQSELLLEKFQTAEKKLSEYSKLTGPGFYLKVKRLRLLGIKYVLFELCHRLKIQLHINTNLFFGKKMRLPLHDEAIKYLYFFGSLQKTEIQLIVFLIKNLSETDVFYDVGANYGFYSLLAKEVAPDCAVHVFEPQASLQEYLQQNLPAVKRNQIALTDTVGSIDFYEGFDTGASGKSSTKLESVSSRKETYQKVTVESTTLDEYIKTNAIPTFIKIDVEGAEISVLRGARQLLKKHKPTIAMEVWLGNKQQDDTHKATDLLLSLGYKEYDIDSSGELTEITPSNEKGRSYVNRVFKKE